LLINLFTPIFSKWPSCPNPSSNPISLSRESLANIFLISCCQGFSGSRKKCSNERTESESAGKMGKAVALVSCQVWKIAAQIAVQNALKHSLKVTQHAEEKCFQIYAYENRNYINYNWQRRGKWGATLNCSCDGNNEQHRRQGVKQHLTFGPLLRPTNEHIKIA